MKTITGIFISIVLFSTLSIGASGQESLKLGHVNIPDILQKLPETDSIQKVMKKESDEMEKMFGDMIKEHESALKKYETEKESYSEFIRTSKEKELMEMSAKIQQFQQTANEQLQKRNMELVQPIYLKINEAIRKVALKENYTYIFDLSNGAVAYFSPSTKNLNTTILQELGVKH